MDSTLTIGSANGKPIHVRTAAERYLTRGWVPIPLRYKSKQPISKKWEQITLDGFDLDEQFPVGSRLNVGISFGEPSGGLVDCDLDCDEARRAASILMPPTGLIWGRASAPDSHRGYVVADPPHKASHPWTDPLRKGKGARLMELRSTGGQTVVPPSILPGDDAGKIEEPCVWRENGDPAHLDLDELKRVLNRVAAAALIGRYWREGTRHDCVLALAGGLLRAGWAVDDVVALVRAVCAAACDDEIIDRERAVRDTASAIERGEQITGWPTLVELLGEHGDTIVKTVCAWLEISWNSRDNPQHQCSGKPTTNQTCHTEIVAGFALRVDPAPGKSGKFVVVVGNESGELHRDVIDLNSATSRKRFIYASLPGMVEGAAPDGPQAEVREKLDQRLRAYAANPPKVPDPTVAPPDHTVEDPRAAELAKMPADVLAEAEERLRDPDLLNRVSTDIRALGVVGEKNNRQILYLVGTSAQLPRPLAVIFRGASSSGKSFLGEQVSRLFPPEVVLRATRLTTNALYHFRPGTLRHRMIVAGERSRLTNDDAAEATRALREMIESGRLSKAIPMKEGDRFVTHQIEQDGPIAYLESTTAARIDEEDANRCLLLTTDETENQTRRIIKATATAAAGQGCDDVTRICEVHHAIQRMIPRVDVIVPFAEAISEHYPTARLESRRDFRHLLQLVKAIALLHFRQRKRDASGAVIATLDDYATAEQLAREPLGAAASGVSAGARDLLEQLRELHGTSEFTTTQVKQLGGASHRTLENRLLTLNNVGAVEQIEPPKGRIPAKWKLTGRDPASGEGVLPSPDVVRESLSGCEHANNT